MKTRHILALLGGFAVATLAQAGDATKLPPMKTQPTAKKVLDEHYAALNNCDWSRLIAQHPMDTEVHLAGGVVLKGREKVGELYAGLCKDRPDGLRGIKFTPRKRLPGGQHLQHPVACRSAVPCRTVQGL